MVGYNLDVRWGYFVNGGGYSPWVKYRDTVFAVNCE